MSSNSRDGSTRVILRALRRAGSCAIAEPPVGSAACGTYLEDRCCPGAAGGAPPDRLVVCAPVQGGLRTGPPTADTGRPGLPTLTKCQKGQMSRLYLAQ